MPNLLLGDIRESFNSGMQDGRAMRFNDLAGQAVAAPQDQRSGLLAMAAQADPLKSVALSNALAQQDTTAEDRRNTQLVNMAKYLKGAPDAYKEQAYQRIRPALLQFGIQAPEKYDPQVQQVADSIVNAYTPISQQPSGLREIQGQISGAGLSPDEAKKAYRVSLGLDPRAVSGAAKTGMITGADGRERPFVFDPSTQQYKVFDGQSFRPLDAGEATQLGATTQTVPSQPSQPTPEQLMAQATAMANQGGPGANAAAAEAWLKQNLEGQGRMPGPASGAGALGVGRAPEDKAAATENAKQGVQLAYLPRTEAVKTQADIERAAGTERAKADVEADTKRTADARQRQKDAQETLTLLDAAERILPNATGSAGGRLIDSANAAVGRSTEGAQATAKLQTIAGQLTSKMPRMQGPQSDRDVELYKQMAGDLANSSLPVETRRAAAQTIRELNQKYANSTVPSQPSAQPTPTGNFGHLWN